MIELNIKGKDVQELYVNGVNMLLLLTRGGQDMFQRPATTASAVPVAESSPQTESPKDEQPDAETVVTAEPNPPVIEPAPPKTRKPRTPKEPVTIEATANPQLDIVDAVNAKVDEDPFAIGEPTKPAAEAPKLTLDDMRQRVKDIITKHTERQNAMPVCIAYVRKLFEPFGIKLAAELKPEQFDEFWRVSATYLDGSAK